MCYVLYSSRADVSGAALFYLLWLPPRYPALFRYVWLAAALLLLLLALAARSAWRARRRLTQLLAAFCCAFSSPLVCSRLGLGLDAATLTSASPSTHSQLMIAS